ncbi:hypothetical protein CERZMDRAFT_101179 [Cercospora zeae-maydis SCOH1-5]|uniref:Uncharacterized protein n=1 Tax=Cercospora zeae-maydis SCOH1-5 TaxID=717836 RepID=A0A6A6F4P5_9PEZI|nr:hypothetical protein CERZMDRAFT_101179 [Cercospora zeae-maydis SCOH1-5]
MGNVCSFDSPDLVKAVLVGAAGAAVPVIPTFANAVANAAFLSVIGSFTYNEFAPTSGPCQIPTASTTTVDGTISTVTYSVTPYISGPDGRTDCAPLTPTSVDDRFTETTYTVLSCPSVTLTALPTGQHVLGFDYNGPTTFAGFQKVSFEQNTFTIGLPPPTTTLPPSPATTSTETKTLSTDTITTTLQPAAETTITITVPTATTTVTSTNKIQSVETTTKTVYTKTITATTVIVGNPYGTSTSTKYTGTTTKKATRTVTSTTSVCKDSYNKRGVVMARDGGHPDFTYPPDPTTVTVTPEPLGTSTVTVYVTATETRTVTPARSGTVTVSSFIEATETSTVTTTELSTAISTLKADKTVTTTSTSRKKGCYTTIYCKKTIYVTTTKTAKATVTRKDCKGRGYY